MRMFVVICFLCTSVCLCACLECIFKCDNVKCVCVCVSPSHLVDDRSKVGWAIELNCPQALEVSL